MAVNDGGEFIIIVIEQVTRKLPLLLLSNNGKKEK